MVEAPTQEAAESAADFEAAHGPAAGPLDWLVYLLFRLAVGGFSRLPPAAAGAVVGTLARIARRVDRRHSAAARDFLRAAEPALRGAALEARVTQAYRHFFQVVLESERFLREVPPERTLEHFEVAYEPGVRELLAARPGVVIVSGHIGNWELGSTCFAALGLGRFVGVAKPVKNRFISRYVYASRARRGVEVLPRRGAMAAAPAIVGRGDALGLLLDQRARKRPVLAPFFGRPANCDRSVGVLLRRLGHPVVFAACTRIPGADLRFRAHLGPVLRPDEVAGARPEDISARINLELERMIRAAPEQYFWLHDRYRDAPAAAELVGGSIPS
jgi:KDO2-lipid IV(A) lauroyltransferase